MPEIAMGNVTDPKRVLEMAREAWDGYGLHERSDWAKEAMLKGFGTGFDALLSASYIAYEKQLPEVV